MDVRIGLGRWAAPLCAVVGLASVLDARGFPAGTSRRDEDDDDSAVSPATAVAVFCGALALCFCCTCCVFWATRAGRESKLREVLSRLTTQEGLEHIARLAATRLVLMDRTKHGGGGAPCPVPPSGRYTGAYEENGEKKSVSYRLNFFADGAVTGTGTYKHRAFQVKGAYDSKEEVYRWGETLRGAKYAHLDNDASAYCAAILSGRAFHVEVEIAFDTATALKSKLRRPSRLAGVYFASTNVKGAVRIKMK